MNDLDVIEKAFGDLAPYRQCPPFWVPTPEQGGQALIDALREVSVRVIGRTAGGREIVALEYGEREDTGATCDNLASAMSSMIGDSDVTRIYPEAFYGRTPRTRPSLCIQGGIHGSELTGTVAALNLCRVIETGCDLRGQAWPELAELARGTRLTIIPWLNMDGVARNPVPNPVDAPGELQNRCTMGVARDGTCYRYPAMKAVFPIPPETTAFMGCYFNDAGVNLQYDFCMPERQPETLAWMRYYLEERPEAVLISHCNAGTLFGPPESLLPESFQHAISRAGGAVRQRLVREGHPVGRLSWVDLPGLGKPAVNQMNAIYHVCGALPLLCEFPSGQRGSPYTLERLLDVGLLVLEETLRFGRHDGFRPNVWREKNTPRAL